LRAGAMPERRRAPRLSHLASFAAGVDRGVEIAETGPVRKGALLARNPTWQEQEFPLPLRRLDVDIHIDNQVARVALDQTFFNPRQQQLEGVYRLTLPPGAAISRQAMFVDGVLRESAIVERQRARRIYEDIVYTQRDPALMEWMAGNQFQVRVFPLPPRSEKRLVIEYTQNLPRLYDDVRVEVPLPDADSPIGSQKLHARVVGCAACTITSTSHAITTTADGADALVDAAREGAAGGGSLLLTIRQPRTGARVAAQRDGEHTYWMARVQPHLDAGAAAPGKRRWVILHDTSASRGALELKAQTYLIDRLLQELDEEDEVDVVAFDTTVRQLAPDFVRVSDVDRAAVARFLGRESRDSVGATDLATALDRALALLARAPADAVPHILYLGDGIATGAANGIETLRRKIGGKAVFVGVAVGARMDMVKLNALAARTGGYATAMNPGDDLGWRAFDLVAALNTPRVVDLAAEALDGEGRPIAGTDLYSSARQLADGEELDLLARLPGAAPASLRLSGTLAGQPWTQTIALPRPAGEPAGYLPRLWAQRRIEALLSGDVEGGKSEITALGIEHFLITPYTSLLVLESDAMARQYDVAQRKVSTWAAYPLPARIPVVYEPIGGTVATPAGPVDAVLVRSRTRLFQSYGYYAYRGESDGRFDTVTETTTRAGWDEPSFATHLEVEEEKAEAKEGEIVANEATGETGGGGTTKASRELADPYAPANS
ncbi:MAG TPA: VIT and VWA domain-containing protein, partial [Kofleriaceae bacterium]|nr:VIT and VWA domain-containing protein [Kofleriaceae bacterium]